MSTSTPNPQRPQRRLPVSTLIVVLVLLVLPVVALVDVPLYSRITPRVWGFPFFYWWQFLWMFLETGMIYLAYVLITRARRGSSR